MAKHHVASEQSVGKIVFQSTTKIGVIRRVRHPILAILAWGPSLHSIDRSQRNFYFKVLLAALRVKNRDSGCGVHKTGSFGMPSDFASFIGSEVESLLVWLPLGFCLLFLTSGAQTALTSGEIGALEQLYANFPSLVFAHRHVIEFTSGEYYGKAWTTAFTSYCDHGEGYEFNGVFCHDGHVSGLNINEQWGARISSNYSLISGLAYLKNITLSYLAPTENVDLLIEVLRTLPVESIEGCTPAITDTMFMYPELVLSLVGQVASNFNLSSFSSLKALSIYNVPVSVLDTWVWPYSTLETVELQYSLPISWWLSHYHLFPVLRVLKGYWNTGTSGTLIPAVLESETLQELHIILMDSTAPVNFTLNCSTCLDVRLSWSLSNVSVIAPSLQRLWIETSSAPGLGASWPDLSTPLYDLKELIVNSMGRNDPPEAFPSLGFAPSLESFQWSYPHIDHANWLRVICSLPSSLGFLSLSMMDVDQTLQFPSCLNNLRSVVLSSSAFNSTALLLNLPTTVTLLRLVGAFETPVTFDSLTKFTQLTSLSLNDKLVGEIPTDFFQTLPRLSDFYCYCTSVTGTIPSLGWHHIETFTLTASVTSWDGIDSAPNLRRLTLFTSLLTRLPSNEQFLAANLQSLAYINIASLRVPTPVPTFWASLPNIEEVYLGYNQFSGPFNATLSSPSLIYADLSHNNICGSLPEVSRPIQPDQLLFDQNRFSGSIPDSWALNLSYISRLSFHNNPINGTLPDGLILHDGLIQPTGYPVDLSNTQLVGPVWNMSRFPPPRITIVNSGVNICLVDPEIPSGFEMDCNFDNVTFCPDDCPSYWPCSSYSPPCHRLSSFAPQIVGECLAPIVDLGPLASPFQSPLVSPFDSPFDSPFQSPFDSSIQCPPPPPPGFSCIDGQYISNGSVTFQLVSLPSDAGVIVVKGNLTINGPLTFSGLGSTIQVEGCLEVAPSQIHIVLTSAGASPRITLIHQQGTDCANDLSKIPVIVDQPKDTCKRSKLSTSDSTRASLVVAFTLDSSRCNLKWIILGSVLGGVLILSVVAVVILHMFSSSFRAFFKKKCCCSH